MIAQDLLEKSYYRDSKNIAFDYNKTDSTYNSSTILFNDLCFLALQEPNEKNKNLFFKLLMNHRVGILVRLKPEKGFYKNGSFTYWENRLEQHVAGSTKLLISDYEFLQPSSSIAITYYFSEDWEDDKQRDVEKLYKLVQQIRKTYHS